jgi:hypothetical protein
MKLGELTTQARTMVVVFTLGIVLAACGDEKTSQLEASTQAAESMQHETEPAQAQEQTPKPAVASKADMMTKEIGAMYVELKRYEAELAAKEQALQQLQQELDAAKADLAAKDNQVRFLASQLEKREGSLRTYKIIAFSGLGIGAIMFLVGYLSLRAGKKRKSQVPTAEAERPATA